MAKLSVCVATYNGQLFIRDQLASILKQLSPDDEIIVVDDNSSDATLHLIEGINDSRIKIFRNDTNSGVIKTFEKAVNKAGGDIIFLSDQDDVWLDGKVNKIVGLFSMDKELTLVLSDAQIIDSKGDITYPSYFARIGGFRSGALRNIIQNRYLGCTMAIKKETLRHVMPFPPDIPMHDMWIGIVNSIFGKEYFVNEPLIQYRRHDKNATSFRHAGLKQMLRWRISLLKNLLLLLTRKCVGNPC